LNTTIKYFPLKPLVFLVALFFLSVSLSFCQETNQTIYKTVKATQLPDNKGDALVKIASNFLGKPYVGYTLEEEREERLIVNLKEFDCSTLVEQSLAILLSSDYNSFRAKLKQIRYRNGQIKGYGSRLHYLTDWLLENQRNGIVKLESKSMGGELYNKEVNFMSKNWDKYPRANTESIKTDILKAEKALANNVIYYFPKNKITSIEKFIKNGNIIAITTSKAGLDCSHQGIAVIKNGHLHLLHASSTKQKVIISDEKLADYLKKNKLQTGIIVARLQ
jgi:Protein of unknown function (DUF1460)